MDRGSSPGPCRHPALSPPAAACRGLPWPRPDSLRRTARGGRIRIRGADRCAVPPGAVVCGFTAPLGLSRATPASSSEQETGLAVAAFPCLTAAIATYHRPGWYPETMAGAGTIRGMTGHFDPDRGFAWSSPS